MKLDAADPFIVPHTIPWIPVDASWLTILQACIPVVIAAMVAWVGWRQLHAARAKLKFDLFKQRKEVFNAAKEVWLAGIGVEVAVEGPLLKLRALLPDANFLFDKNLFVLLITIHSRAREAEQDKKRFLSEGPDGHQSLHLKVIEHQRWFNEQALRSTELFDEYLSFRNWR